MAWVNPQFADFKFPDEPVLTLGDLIISEAKNDGESSLSDDAGKTAERNALFWFVHLQSANNVAETTEEKSSQDVNAVDEDFFRITEKDLKVMHRCLKEEARIHNERGFISKEVQEARNLEAKRRAYTRSIIRFSFHHELFVQAQFFSGEPVDAIFKFIRGLLRDKSTELELIVPPNTVIKPSCQKSLLQIGLAPKSLISIRFPRLGDETLETSQIFDLDYGDAHLCSPVQADEVGAQWLSTNSPFHGFDTSIPDPEAVKAAQQEKEAKILRFIGGNKRGATQTAGNASKRSNMEIGDGNEGEKPTSSNSLNSKSKTVPKWFKKQ